MPIFDYTCDTCGTTREILCRHDAKKSIQCPECEHGALTRDMIQNPPVIQFVGNGWPGQDKKLEDSRRRAGDITDPSHAIKHNALKHRITGYKYD